MQNKIESGSKVIVLGNNSKGVVRAILVYPGGKSFAEVQDNMTKHFKFYDTNNLALDLEINNPVL